MADIINLSKIAVAIIKRKRSYLNESWHGERVNANFSRLYYIKEGKGFIESGGKRYQLQAGRLYIIPPRGNFTYGCNGELEIWWVHFTATLLAGISLFDYLSYEAELVPDNKDAIEKKISRLIDCIKAKSICNTIQCNGVLLDLIADFLHQESCSIKTNYHKKVDRFLPVLKYINSNLADRITVDQLAAISNYERSHFTVLFKDLFGVSPMHYTNQQRVDAVLLMLQTSDKKLEELAVNYGFYDACHLSKVVKQFTGKSPRTHMRIFRESAP